MTFDICKSWSEPVGRVLQAKVPGVRLETVITHSQTGQATAQLLQSEPDPDHQAQAGRDWGQEQQEEEDPHVGSSVRLQRHDTELSSSPGRAEVLDESYL